MQGLMIQQEIGEVLIAIGAISLLIFAALIFTRKSKISVTEIKPPPMPEALRKKEPELTITEIKQETEGRLLTEFNASFLRPDPIAISMGESALKFELSESPEIILSEREPKILAERFDRLTLESNHPDEVARGLVDFTSKLCHSPALFFAYEPKRKAAVLRSHAGLIDPSQVDQMSFPITETLLKQISQSHQGGTLPSLTNYGPLVGQVFSRLKSYEFRAWALADSSHGFLGALVAIKPALEAKTRYDALSSVIHTSSLVYEKTLLSRDL
jgi:hypothetical protein